MNQLSNAGRMRLWGRVVQPFRLGNIVHSITYGVDGNQVPFLFSAGLGMYTAVKLHARCSNSISGIPEIEVSEH
jgi:hypothetical protein